MTQPNIISEEAISMYDVLSSLKKMEKEDGELNFRAEKTKEYIQEVKQLTDKKAKEVTEGILALDIPRLRPEHIVKILDVNPVSVEDLKQLIASFNITVKDDNLKKIIEVLKA
ncbi:MAG: hypothetical protein ACMXYK_05685 [Candidatus Woesearchaeota archaeon]